MFERYTAKARRTVFFARYEASRYGSPEITTEHLLLGLLREDRKAFGPVTWSLGGRIEEVLRSQEAIGAKAKIPPDSDLPLSDAGKRVLAYAADEAERLGSDLIGTEHMAMALLREPSCRANKILTTHGVDPVRLLEVIGEMAKTPTSQATTHAAPEVEEHDQEVRLEFFDRAKNTPIATVPLPSVIPGIGEEIVFEAPGGLTRAFRVVDVSYVYQMEKAPRKKLSRIIVALQSPASKSNLAEPGPKGQ